MRKFLFGTFFLSGSIVMSIASAATSQQNNGDQQWLGKWSGKGEEITVLLDGNVGVPKAIGKYDATLNVLKAKNGLCLLDGQVTMKNGQEFYYPDKRNPSQSLNFKDMVCSYHGNMLQVVLPKSALLKCYRTGEKLDCSFGYSSPNLYDGVDMTTNEEYKHIS